MEQIQTLKELLKEAHPTKNSIDIDSLTQWSNKKLWWICKKNHEWESSISVRSKGSGCPYCSGRKVWAGFNDLQTLFPSLVLEWNYALNDKKPYEVTKGSHYKAHWVCINGHNWQAKVNDRCNGNGCLQCYKDKASSSNNNILNTHPEVAVQWDYDNNIGTPKDYSSGSSYNAAWICDYGHLWTARVSDRCGKKLTGCPICSKMRHFKNGKSLLETHPKLIEEWDYSKNPISPDRVSHGSSNKVNWKCKLGHSWNAVIADRSRGKSNCPTCSSQRYTSVAEKQIKKILASKGLTVIESDRKTLKGREIDLLVPDLFIGIEFNGVYWHTEDNGKDSLYHYKKYKDAKDNGITLIQIWEDDWNSKQDVVVELLLNKIGKSNRSRVFARNTVIKEIDSESAKAFLEKFHIQGWSRSTHYIAAINNGEIVAVCSFKKAKNKSYEITRFATSVQLLGGFSKIIKHFEKNYDYSSIYTFSDNSISKGELYANNGFVFDKEIVPDYSYLVKGKREHKFNYRLKRFKQDTSLIYLENTSERELAKLNGLSRIWDSGKIRWVKPKPQ